MTKDGGHGRVFVNDYSIRFPVARWLKADWKRWIKAGGINGETDDGDNRGRCNTAGVSVATVSRVFSGKSAQDSEQAKRVFQAVRELQYSPTRHHAV